MATPHADLPSDVASLRALVTRQRQYIENLEEALRLIRHQVFGRKSEATPREQLGLFNEAEAILDAEESEQAEVRVPAHTRQRGGRRPLPEALPRIEILHDLPEAEKVCPADGHALVEIRREVSEQLEVIPATVQVLQHVP